VGRLRDSVSVMERTLDILRNQLASSAAGGTAGAEALTGMATAIARQEEALASGKASLAKAVEDLQETEKAFLRSGVQSRTRRTAEREVVGARSAYVFTKKSAGPALKMRFSSSSREDAGNDFHIAPVGRFARPETLPGGLVYQIYLFTSPRHATLDDLFGMTPVYERMTTTLRYAYAAGVFTSYAAALSALPSIRRLGFPDATVIAFRDGIPISVADARRLEAAR
jgi:hypothetical protein